MHSHDNTQSLMFITFQNKKISSVFTLCLLNRKKDEGSKQRKDNQDYFQFPQLSLPPGCYDNGIAESGGA